MSKFKQRSVSITSSAPPGKGFMTRVIVNDIDISEMVKSFEFRQPEGHEPPFIRFTALASLLDKLPKPDLKAGETGSIQTDEADGMDYVIVSFG